MLKKIIFLLFTIFFIPINAQITVMIDPAGDSKNVGRKLVESYERTITFKLAEKLKQKLHERYSYNCVLTKYYGEEVIELQNASFANRLNVDLYLSLNVFRHEFAKPKLFLYNLIRNRLVDFAVRSIDQFKFVSVYQSHYLNINKTKVYVESIKNYFRRKEYANKFDFYGAFGIPIKSLIGITAPAIAIEIGLCNEDQLDFFVEPIVESLNFLYQEVIS